MTGSVETSGAAGAGHSTPPLPDAGPADRTRRQREAHVPTEQPEAGQAPRLSAPHADPSRASHPEVPPSQGPGPPVGVIWRIRERSTFERFRRDGRRFRSGPLWMTVITDPAATPPRVAYAIGRSVGNAVERNRVRRRLRALAQAHAAELGPGWYLLGADARFAQVGAAEAADEFRALVRASSSEMRRQ